MRRRTMIAGLPGSLVFATASRARAETAQPAAATIGVINDMSGSYSDLGGKGSLLGAQMAVEDFGGAVLGQQVRVLAADHKNQPDLASTLAGDWINRQGVTAIADGGASSAALAIQQVTASKRCIFLATGPATSDLTGVRCSPFGFHWTYDSYSLASGTAKTLARRGAKTWFFITAAYAFGHSVERDTTQLVNANGGHVLGHVLAPIGNSDFSSHLLQAKASGADVIGLAVGGGDLISAVKQAHEFGMTGGKQALAGLLTFITDVHAMGLEAAQGMVVTTSYDWEINAEMAAFAARFMARSGGRPPTMVQAGTYSGVQHYLKATAAAGTLDADAVAAKMRAMPVQDFMSKDVAIRADGRVMRTNYVVSVKSPEQSRKPWDYFSLLATIDPNDAFRSLADGHCSLVSSKT